MFRIMLKSKIHRAVVTEANINYVGSVTIDEDLMKAADLLEWEKVALLDIDNGSRLETYVIRGEPGSGTICVNGAAARLVQPGDKLIILSYANVTEEEARSMQPTIVLLDERNRISDFGVSLDEATVA